MTKFLEFWYKTYKVRRLKSFKAKLILKTTNKPRQVKMNKKEQNKNFDNELLVSGFVILIIGLTSDDRSFIPTNIKLGIGILFLCVGLYIRVKNKINNSK